MKIKDALAVLNIQSDPVTSADIKTAYQKAVSLYHPDRNPAGLEMMKIINVANDVLKGFEGPLDRASDENYGELLNNALKSVIDLGLTIEICGTWIWVSGDTKPHGFGSVATRSHTVKHLNVLGIGGQQKKRVGIFVQKKTDRIIVQAGQ